MKRERSQAERLRSIAIALVDAQHGYTMEFAPSPIAHRFEYDNMEHLLGAVIRTDGSKLVART